jgi:hypothetical protein
VDGPSRGEPDEASLIAVALDDREHPRDDVDRRDPRRSFDSGQGAGY